MQQWQLFQQQLQTSAENFLWAVEQIPQEQLYLAPRPNRWPVARVVYHMIRYEQRLALPSMQQWLGGSKPVVGTQEEDNAQDERDWNDGKGRDIQTLLTDFRDIRSQQLALFPQFTEQSWEETRNAIWGDVSLKWLVIKTYQHTLEHTDEVLRAYLWWR
jgi:hypothetical protein